MLRFGDECRELRDGARAGQLLFDVGDGTLQLLIHIGLVLDVRHGKQRLDGVESGGDFGFHGGDGIGLESRQFFGAEDEPSLLGGTVGDVESARPSQSIGVGLQTVGRPVAARAYYPIATLSLHIDAPFHQLEIIE